MGARATAARTFPPSAKLPGRAQRLPPRRLRRASRYRGRLRRRNCRNPAAGGTSWVRGRLARTSSPRRRPPWGRAAAYALPCQRRAARKRAGGDARAPRKSAPSARRRPKSPSEKRGPHFPAPPNAGGAGASCGNVALIADVRARRPRSRQAGLRGGATVRRGRDGIRPRPSVRRFRRCAPMPPCRGRR